MNSELEVMALEQANAEGDVEGEGEVTPAHMTDPKIILAFMFAGDATVTIRGKERRYTYRINKGDLRQEDVARGYTQPPYWVKYLAGSDNENDYQPLGMIQFGLGGKTPKFKVTKNVKSATRETNGFPKPMVEQAPHIKGFNMVFEALLRNQLINGMEIWHEGRCSRCNRKLTDDVSIERGFGPTCFKLMGGIDGIQQFYVSMFPLAALGLTTGTAAVVAAPAKAFGSSSYTGTDAAYHYAPTSVGESIVDVRQRFVPKPKPTTPKAIVAAVNEDAEIAKLAAELWAKNPVNPANAAPKVAVEPLPVDDAVAVALAKSQTGWTVDDAKEALAKRKIVNLNLKPSTKVSDKVEVLVFNDSATGLSWHDVPHDTMLNAIKVGSDSPLLADTSHLVKVFENGQYVGENDPLIIAKVNALKTDHNTFTSDGIMDDEEAFSFWYRRFAANSTPVEG